MRYCNWQIPYRVCPACTYGVPGVANHVKWYNENFLGFRYGSRELMPIEKPVPKADAGVVVGFVGGGEWAVLYPTIFEYMSEGRYADGSARTTSTLLMFIEGGLFKVCFNDRDNGRTAWVTGSTVESALGVLEERLKGNVCEWRTSEKRSSGKGKKG